MNKSADNITYRILLTNGKNALTQAGIEEFEYDAFALLEYVTGMNKTSYLMHSADFASDEAIKKYDEVIKLRQNHIPLQHITGVAYFYGYEFNVNNKVLVPRFDTENLVAKALQIIKSGQCCSDNGKFRVLDMCTGSGCIALTLARYILENKAEYERIDNLEITAADLSAEALEVAKQNAKKLTTDEYNVSGVTTFIQSNLFDDVVERFDMIVSNPPYIPTKVINGLQQEVKLHDPYIALDGHEDGLDFYRDITKESTTHMNNGGWLIYEIGHDQAEAVKAMMIENHFDSIEVIKDMAGLDRVVCGRFREY